MVNKTVTASFFTVAKLYFFKSSNKEMARIAEGEGGLPGMNSEGIMKLPVNLSGATAARFCLNP